jgi:tetratricopeptide (TPR) repeat protein
METPFFKFSFYKDENFSLKKELLQNIQEAFRCQIFIETGTLYGQTSEKAAQIFPEVHTIELSEPLYRRALEIFQSKKKVSVYHGDSGNLLPHLLKKLQGRIVFWLDGHFSGGETARAEKDTPIIDELKAIKESGMIDSVIMIDDLRNYDSFFPQFSSRSAIQDYPPIKVLYDYITSINHRYEFAVIGDILLAFIPPETMTKPMISEIVQACTISRLSAVGPWGLEDILNAEIRIGKAEGFELELLQNLYKIYRGDEKFGYCKHYRLWYALTLLEEKNYPQAYKEFTIANILGFDHWRIEWYLAQAAFRGGDFSLAKKHLATIRGSVKDFQPAFDLLEQIRIARSNGKLSLSADDHLDLAVHYCLSDKTEKATAQLDQALVKDTNISKIRTQYAEMLLEFDQLSQAEAQLQLAVRNDPLFSPAFNDLGVLFRHYGDLGKAMEYFGEAFNLDNGNYKALKNMLLLAKEMGLAQQANDLLAETITKHGSNRMLSEIENELLQ